MDIKKKYEDLKFQKSYSIPAKDLLNNLKPILSKSDELKKRWIWELLQNASDLGNEIFAELELTNDKMIFRHNGKPFTLNEADNLIKPDSSKDDESSRAEKKIGQFGTGFISTHILSKIIQVIGIVYDSDTNEYSNFNFKLDRSNKEDKNLLIQSIKKSENEFSKSLQRISNYKPNEFNTEFIYYTNDVYEGLNGSKIIKAGFENLLELIPFVFSFRPQLKKVIIKDYRNGKNDLWTIKSEELNCNIKDLKISKTIIEKNREEKLSLLIGTITNKKATIAIKIEHIKDKTYRILPYPINEPKLYSAFPMVGTNDFNFPVIIHSEFFIPNRERDGIELTEYDKENRERLIEAKNAFFNLIKIIEENNWIDCYNLFNIKRIEIKNEIKNRNIQQWYFNEILNPIKNKLYESKLVELEKNLKINEHRKPLKEIYVPYYDKRETNNESLIFKIYDLAFKIIPDKLPKNDHLLNWYKILDFEIFSKEKLNLLELVKLVNKNLSISDFNKNYSLLEKDATYFLKELIKFILEQEKNFLLNNFSIIPNQNNNLKKQYDLKIDKINNKYLKEGYPDKLKEIIKQLTNRDYKESLLHNDFEIIDNLIDSKKNFTLKEITNEIDNKLRTYKGNFKDDNFLIILKEIFYWYNNCGMPEELLNEYFPYFSSNKAQLYLNTKTSKELEFAFDIEISGKSEVLAKIAKTNLSPEQLNFIAENSEIVSSFFDWINHKLPDNPDKDIGNIGEKFLYSKLCEIFGENRVIWENRPEYDFRILNSDMITTKYYIDAKTTGKGIANTENIPFFLRSSQWKFLEKEEVLNKYLIARINKIGNKFEVKYIKINLTKIT